MARLIVKFDSTVLKEVPMGSQPIVIGRAPDSEIRIDNLAVSNRHARIFSEDGRLVVEDLDSLNGTYLNGGRIKRQWLRSGDAILIGKHVILVDEEHDAAAAADDRPRSAAPKIEETVVLGGHRPAETKAEGASDRARVPNLVVLRGRTSQSEYVLSSKLTVIGKSPMATVRLRGWFAPQVAAQISKHPDGYYLRAIGRAAKVNGEAVSGARQLSNGDRIEIGRIALQFVYRD